MGEVYFGAGAIIQNKSGEILLIQEGKEHVKGQWNIPSGGYEKGETIEETARREIREETGLEIELEGIIGLHTRDAQRNPDTKYVMAVFEASKTGGDSKSGYQDEILDAKYFRPEEIQNLNLRFELEPIIQRLQENGSKEIALYHQDIQKLDRYNDKVSDPYHDH